MDNVKVGNFIKVLLEERSMTQQDLASKLYISKAAVSKNLKGKNSFDIGNLQKIAELFDLSVDELINAKRKGVSVPISRVSNIKPKIDKVQNYQDVLINARTYIKDINIDRYTYNDMSMSKYWYYFEELDTFAANKFLAYKDNNKDKYYHFTKVYDVMDGGHARRHLEKFFVATNDKEIYQKFREFQKKYNIKNSKKIEQAVIYIKKKH